MIQIPECYEVASEKMYPSPHNPGGIPCVQILRFKATGSLCFLDALGVMYSWDQKALREMLAGDYNPPAK